MSITRDKRVETIAKMISEDLGDDMAYVMWKTKLEELILEYQNPHVYGLQATWNLVITMKI